MNFGGVTPQVAAVVIAAQARKSGGGGSEPPEDDEFKKDVSKIGNALIGVAVAAVVGFLMVIIFTS